METAVPNFRDKIQIFKSLIASEPVYVAFMKSVSNCAVDSKQALHKDFYMEW